MNIAFLTMGSDIGGAKQDVLTLSVKIEQMGHNVFVISTPGVMDKELADTRVRFIPAELSARGIFGLWKASRELIRIVKENNIELLNPQGMYPAAASWLAKLGLFSRIKIPIVTTIHMISTLKLYKYAWTLNYFSDAIITESNCERIRLESNGVKRESISVIYNSVDMTKFSKDLTTPVLRREYCIANDCVTFGIIARLSAEKRHEDFIEAAKLVTQNNPNTRFFIVGEGPEKEKLVALTQGIDNIIFTGHRRDIPDVLRSLDCYVLCSKIESLPLSIREAMSMKVPQIVTDVGGNREIVIENVTGFVVPPFNPNKLAEAMNRIASDKELRIKFGENGYKYCKKRFNANDWAFLTEQKFKEIIAK